MKPQPDSTADLRRQLAEQRAARSASVERLKDVAEKAAAGKRTPITDKFRLDDDESSESDASLPTIAKIQRCTAKVKAARAARTKEVRTLQQTTMAVVQIVRQTTHPDEPNGNGAGAPGAAPA